MFKSATQIAIDAAIYKRTASRKQRIILSEDEVKTFDYLTHLKKMREARLTRRG